MCQLQPDGLEWLYIKKVLATAKKLLVITPQRNNPAKYILLHLVDPIASVGNYFVKIWFLN